jgi:hypothetical protein
MSRKEIRWVVEGVIMHGPVHQDQFRQAWEMVCLMLGSIGGAVGLVCIVLRWCWRVIRLLLIPVTLPVLTWHYRCVRVRSIRKARAARDEWKAQRKAMRQRIHKFGDEIAPEEHP